MAETRDNGYVNKLLKRGYRGTKAAEALKALSTIG